MASCMSLTGTGNFAMPIACGKFLLKYPDLEKSSTTLASVLSHQKEDMCSAQLTVRDHKHLDIQQSWGNFLKGVVLLSEMLKKVCCRILYIIMNCSKGLLEEIKPTHCIYSYFLLYWLIDLFHWLFFLSNELKTYFALTLWDWL